MRTKTIPKSNSILKSHLLNVKKIGNMPGTMSIEYPTDSSNKSIYLCTFLMIILLHVIES